MLDHLIERAKQAAKRFDRTARRPIVVEFAGSPKAGKTSTIGQVASFFKRCGFRVEVVIERASVCPIRDKKHANFNVWTLSSTLAQLLEKTQDPPRPDDPQILILDRGVFDAICWLTMMEHLARIKRSDREKIESFLLIDDWRTRLSGVTVMTASPEDAMRREGGLLPVPGSSGSIMNPAVLNKFQSTTDDVTSRLKKSFRFFMMNTSAAKYRDKPKATCEAIADNILNWIEEQLDEAILHLPKEKVTSLFQKATTLDADAAAGLLEQFHQEGEYKPREQVEENESVLQALPVVIVRNSSGHILQLRRRERDDSNPLHEKIVLWAGGHVRQEDGAINGTPILQAAVRELHEELRLDVEKKDLTLIGAVYTDVEGNVRKHVAFVFEWRAASDDVAVSLSSAEFFERRGTSLSGKFVPVQDLVNDIEAKKIDEGWSCEILSKLLDDTASLVTNDLFDR